MHNEYSRVCARIDLGAVEYNLNSMRANIPAGTKIMAVIKTDAYGHGAVEIAQDLENKDYIWGYATATA
ncbi:MAG: alanine racemase, partial [Butyrivibrio sp.]|nr:alanine racemase [Butyrivibrio sp.]